MDLGMIGLGRMGANLVRRLLRDGHRAVVYDVDPASVAALVSEGADGADSLADLAGKLSGPRAVWVMVPAGITGQVIDDFASHLDAGDIIIDGGNSFYQDDLARSATLSERGRPRGTRPYRSGRRHPSPIASGASPGQTAGLVGAVGWPDTLARLEIARPGRS